MVALHVDLQIKANADSALEQTFRETFRPAVSAQQGFVDVALLRAGSKSNSYRLVIAFESEALRLKWVETELHQQVWPQMEAHCEGFEANGFEAV